MRRSKLGSCYCYVCGLAWSFQMCLYFVGDYVALDTTVVHRLQIWSVWFTYFAVLKDHFRFAYFVELHINFCHPQHRKAGVRSAPSHARTQDTVRSVSLDETRSMSWYNQVQSSALVNHRLHTRLTGSDEDGFHASKVKRGVMQLLPASSCMRIQPACVTTTTLDLDECHRPDLEYAVIHRKNWQPWQAKTMTMMASVSSSALTSRKCSSKALHAMLSSPCPPAAARRISPWLVYKRSWSALIRER